MGKVVSQKTYLERDVFVPSWFEANVAMRCRCPLRPFVASTHSTRSLPARSLRIGLLLVWKIN